MKPLPIACTLPPDSLNARRDVLLPGLIERAEAVTLVDEGIRLQFPPSTEVLQAIASAIDGERQCCRFLRFEVTVEPDGGPIVLEVTGPQGTRDFLSATFGLGERRG